MLGFFNFPKYRIIEENNLFYPEQKYSLFFWSRFSVWCNEIVFFKDASFKTLKEAEQFLKIQTDKQNKKPKIIHKFKN